MAQPEQKATVGQIKRIIRKHLARHPEHEETALNIYPMMDMMTILLVFLIMQFASDNANVVQSEELRIPYSISTEEAKQSISVTISQSEIVVDNRPVLSLRNGLVDPSQKQGGGNGFLINALATVMQTHRDRLELIAQRNPQRPFTGDIQIIADRRTPYRTLIEVVYTCGQSRFSNLRFVVLQQTGGG